MIYEVREVGLVSVWVESVSSHPVHVISLQEPVNMGAENKRVSLQLKRKKTFSYLPDRRLPLNTPPQLSSLLMARSSLKCVRSLWASSSTLLSTMSMNAEAL